MELKMYSILDLNKLCRVCLKTSSNMFSIWNKSLISTDLDIQFSQMIMECTSVVVEKEDGLPEFICTNCYLQLENAYCFKHRCEKSDSDLRRIFHILKTTNETCNYVLIDDNNKLPYKIKDETRVKEQEKNVEITENIIQFHDDGIELSNNEVKSEIEIIEDDFYEHDIEDNISNETKSEIGTCVSTGDDDCTLVSFTCSYCLKKFKNKKNLNLHENYCEKTTFSCNQCSKKFESHFLLNLHLSTSHGEVVTSLLTCDICNENFREKTGLIEHFYIHIATSLYFNYNFDDESNVYLCYGCNEHFSTTKKINQHYITHNKNKNYTCRMCNEVFDNVDLLKLHVKEHGILPFFCDTCLLNFDSSRKLKIHNKTHSYSVARDSFACPICKENFNHLFKLKNHLKDHKDDLYKCLECSQLFNSATDLNYHKKYHNVCNLCPDCGKQFSSYSSLYHHIRKIHMEQKRVVCDVCNKSYHSKTSLKIHKRIHSNEKPFICSYCPYSTRQVSDLYTHIRTHTGERPYSCTFPNCDQKFKTSSHRNEHYRRHIGERNYECKICNKKFMQSKILRTHMLTHLDIREHKCDICGKQFRRKHHLKIHKLKIHAVLYMKCNKN